MIDEKKSTYNSSNTDEEGEFCDNCGEKLLGDDNFCPKCGNSVFYKKQEETEEVSDDKDEIEEIKCPYCDSEIPNNVSKCCHCGEWVDKSKDPSISNKINTVFDEVRDEIKNIDTDDIKDTASKGIDEVLDEIKNIDTDDIKDTVSKGIDEVCDEIKNIYTDDIKGKIMPPKKISFVSNRKKLIFVAIALIAIIVVVGGFTMYNMSTGLTVDKAETFYEDNKDKVMTNRDASDIAVNYVKEKIRKSYPNELVQILIKETKYGPLRVVEGVNEELYLVYEINVTAIADTISTAPDFSSRNSGSSGRVVIESVMVDAINGQILSTNNIKDVATPVNINQLK